jgi:hypothetical protein
MSPFRLLYIININRKVCGKSHNAVKKETNTAAVLFSIIRGKEHLKIRFDQICEFFSGDFPCNFRSEEEV